MATPAKKQTAPKKAAPNQKKPVAKTPGRPAGLLTWAVVGLVLVVIAVLVVVKVTTGSNSTATGGFQATSPAVVSELTSVPASVFNAVGVDSPVISVAAPEVHVGEPLYTLPDATGKKLPGLFYFGAEYCPFCAAQRWPTIVALSRFGTFTNLGNTTSSSTDVYANTPSMTFAKVTYTSPYLVFRPIEAYSNVPAPALSPPYQPLMTLTKADQNLVAKYDSPKYFPQMQQQYAGSFPFVSVGNQIMWSGSSISPSSFQGAVRDDVAKNLTDTTNPLSRGIIASANYLTASICHITGQQPSNVCNSKGVQAAKKALKL